MAERASDDRWVVWLVAALGAVVVGLFVGLAGVTSLLLVAFWGCLLGAVIVIPALVSWRAKDSIDSRTPAGRVQLQLLRYAWPLGIAVWLAGRARRLALRRRSLVAFGGLLLLIITGVLVAVRTDWHQSAGTIAGVLLGGTLVGMALGFVATGLLDTLRTLLRFVRRGGQRQP